MYFCISQGSAHSTHHPEHPHITPQYNHKKMSKKIFDRARLLLGEETMKSISDTRVILFGVGGVGSWCAESLVRSGLQHLTIVDGDKVCETNINRQALATTSTIGKIKVEAMRDRLLDINPDADINAIFSVYNKDNADQFKLESYDYVIDAIDSLNDKMELILHATHIMRQQKERQRIALGDTKRQMEVRPHTLFYSSMGAALKIDPLKIRVSEFWEIDGCPLARALRKRMKKKELFPESKFKCVWSPEVLPNPGEPSCCDTSISDISKAQVNGSISHITAVFGFNIAALVLQDIMRQK